MSSIRGSLDIIQGQEEVWSQTLYLFQFQLEENDGVLKESAKDKDDAGSLTPSSNSSLKSLTKFAESSADFTVRYLSRLPKISRVRACTLFIWSPFDLLLHCTMYRLIPKGGCEGK